MTELKQLRDFAEKITGKRPTQRSLKGIINEMISNYVEPEKPEEYDGTYTITANGTLEVKGKVMKDDLTINVE